MLAKLGSCASKAAALVVVASAAAAPDALDARRGTSQSSTALPPLSPRGAQQSSSAAAAPDSSSVSALVPVASTSGASAADAGRAATANPLGVLKAAQPVDRLRYQGLLLFNHFDADKDGAWSPCAPRRAHGGAACVRAAFGTGMGWVGETGWALCACSPYRISGLCLAAASTPHNQHRATRHPRRPKPERACRLLHLLRPQAHVVPRPLRSPAVSPVRPDEQLGGRGRVRARAVPAAGAGPGARGVVQPGVSAERHAARRRGAAAGAGWWGLRLVGGGWGVVGLGVGAWVGV